MDIQIEESGTKIGQIATKVKYVYNNSANSVFVKSVIKPFKRLSEGYAFAESASRCFALQKVSGTH